MSPEPEKTPTRVAREVQEAAAAVAEEAEEQARQNEQLRAAARAAKKEEDDRKKALRNQDWLKLSSLVWPQVSKQI